MNILDTPVAFFRSLRLQADTRPIGVILSQIRDGAHARAIYALRQPGLSQEERDKRKRALPAFMASGTSKSGHKAADFREHSGLLQIDLDGIGEAEAAAVRDAIGQDAHILAAFISPSGSGVKALMRIPASKETHQAAFAAAAEYFRTRYGLEVDAKCKDISRLCFVSDDPGLVLNPHCQLLPVPGIAPAQEKAHAAAVEAHDAHTRRAHSSAFCISESCILDSTSYILHNTLLDDWPALKPLYARNVSRFYGKPQRGQRNAALVEISARLFYIVKPDFVFGMLCHYRHEHQDVFSDYPPADFEREARAMLEGCERSFQQELSELERRAYLALPERERPAFRIARSLAFCESEAAFPPPLFHLSCNGLAVRLGLFDTEAGRILQRLEKRGIIEKIKPGTRREKGEPGRATVWRWRLASDEAQ